MSELEQWQKEEFVSKDEWQKTQDMNNPNSDLNNRIIKEALIKSAASLKDQMATQQPVKTMNFDTPKSTSDVDYKNQMQGAGMMASGINQMSSASNNASETGSVVQGATSGALTGMGASALMASPGVVGMAAMNPYVIGGAAIIGGISAGLSSSARQKEAERQAAVDKLKSENNVLADLQNQQGEIYNQMARSFANIAQNNSSTKFTL